MTNQGWRVAAFAVLSTLAALALAATEARAQVGATLTPDLRSYLVNKDVGVERWTIGFNLSSALPSSFLNVTGNVFKSDGSPPSFILCQVRPDSTGDLTDATSTFSLSCFGTGACATTASECARTGWQPIPGADNVALPASFFLPPGGRGSSTVAQSASASVPPGRLALAWTTLARSATSLLGWLRGQGGTGGPSAAFAQSNDRGATLSLDGFNYLVNKDVGNERWSISLNQVPVRTSDGLLQNQLTSVTGNVFKQDGSAPSFVYCTPRPDSTGTLDDPQSQFSLSCLGTDACTTTATDCAASQWRLISDNVQLGASFFLPPLGLPASVQSDSEIVVIGTTSDPPSIVTTDFSTGASGSAATDRTAGVTMCSVGASCVATVGSCASVTGSIVAVGSGCGCRLAVPVDCIRCDAAESESCGSTCSYPVGSGGATARGYCLPYSAATPDCACYAVGAGQQPTTQRCGGTLGATCSGERCCADDPTDGCNEAAGNTSCNGVCVAADSCAPGVQSCGICFPASASVCGNGTREGAEQCDGKDLGNANCQLLGLSGDNLRCNADCTFDTSGCGSCGDGTRESGEECDGNDLGGASCMSLGFDTGTLRCTSGCRFDKSSCRDCTSGGIKVSCM